MTDAFDAITESDLRRIGGFKWSRYPDATGVFVAEMDFGVAGPVREAIQSAVDDALFGYPPQTITEEMSAACAAWQSAEYGWEILPERVRPLGDVLQGMTVTIEMFTAPGSAVVVPTPAYMPFLKVPGVLGREVIQVPMLRDGDDWRTDLDALDQAFTDGGGLLVLCNPHNPIGKVYTADEMHAITEVVERHGARVFSDEIHAPLVYPGRRHTPYASISPAAAAHTVTATSASKAWNLPGLKCAQLILSDEHDAERWGDGVKGFLAEHAASNLGLIANTAAYSAGGEWLDEVVGYLDGNRRLLGELVAEHLPGVPYSQPDGTYMAWLDCRGLDLGDHPADFFLEHAQVASTDGAECGDVGKGHIRFNFATSRPILESALQRMGRALAGQRRSTGHA